MRTSRASEPTTVWRVAAFAGTCLAVLAMGSDGAAAESCLEQVKSLAKVHDISTDPPTVPKQGNRNLTTRDLAESGGVVEPPAVDDRSVITPPAKEGAPMPTMPDVTPDKKQAANRTALQAILVAARAEAERNNEAGCREGLARAAKILERME
jgi:hypothetical protein